jgi:hypothetical protein
MKARPQTEKRTSDQNPAGSQDGVAAVYCRDEAARDDDDDVRDGEHTVGSDDAIHGVDE